MVQEHVFKETVRQAKSLGRKALRLGSVLARHWKEPYFIFL